MKATAKTAEDAARAVDAKLGQIVKSLTFRIGDKPVLALIAGDHTCKKDALPRVLDMEGKVTKPQAQRVKDVTGFTIGGVAPHRLEGADGINEWVYVPGLEADFRRRWLRRECTPPPC